MSINHISSDRQTSEPSTELVPVPSVNDLTYRGGIGGESAREPEVGMTRYAYALSTRWLVAILLGIPVAAVAATVTWQSVPKVYTTTATMRVAPAERTLVFATADTSRDAANSFDMYKRTQRQLLRSRFVITQALRDSGLTGIPALRNEADPIQWLENNISVNFPDDAEVMNVSLAWTNPEGLHEVLNKVVKAYFEEIVYAEQKRKTARLNDLELAHNRFETQLRTKRAELKNLRERLGIPDPRNLMMDHMNFGNKDAAIRQRLQKLRFEILEHELLLQESGKFAMGADDIEKQLSQMIPLDPELQQLNAARERALSLIRSIKQLLKEEIAAPKIAEQDERLKALDQKIEARKESLRDELISLEQQNAAANQRRLGLLKAQEVQLEAEVKKADGEGRNPRGAADVEMESQEIDGLQEIIRNIAGEIERTKVELHAGSNGLSSRVTELSKALPAAITSTDAKTRLAKAGGAGVISLLLTVCLIIWLEVRKGSILTGRDVEDRLGMSVIGTVPLLPTRVMQRIGHHSETNRVWRNRLSESIDAVAATLLRSKNVDKARVIMVTSATSGEGKTTIAGNLSTSLANAGYRTVVVDFDLRRPRLHRVFGLQLQPGVSDLLKSPDELDAVCQKTETPNLTFIAAGWSNTKGLSSLAKLELETLFDHLRSHFDFVIVDGSPLLPVVDARLIAQHVDAVVVAVMRGTSRLQGVQKVCDLLDRFAIPICGVVLTGPIGEAYPYEYYDSHQHLPTG